MYSTEVDGLIIYKEPVLYINLPVNLIFQSIDNLKIYWSKFRE